MKRRSFLQSLGAGAAASIAACQRIPVRHALPYLDQPSEITPGVPVRYASTCTACPAACGLLVTVRDGRPTKLEGHPDHPLSRGGLCAQAHGDLRALYDADRLRQPSIAGEAATWGGVDAHVTAGLREARSAGKSVVVLSPTLTSPTAREAISELLASYPGIHVEHDPDPETAPAALDAWELLDGRPEPPSLALASVDLLVVLGADLLGTDPDPVVTTRQYADRKRAATQLGPLRHVQIEGNLSLTGAAADERWQATSSERRVIALSLLRAVSRQVGGTYAPDVEAALTGLASLPDHAARIERLAAALVEGRERSVVVTGADDAGEQLAVALCNRILGSKGLDADQRTLVRRGRRRDMKRLREDLEAGTVGALLVVGLDPVDQLPDGEAWRRWLSSVPVSVALTDRPTATASAATVVAAAHHHLEQWGDASPRVGIRTVVQPTLRPLYDTRHPFEALLRWADAKTTDYRAYLMAAWRGDVLSGAADPVVAWNEAVSSGLAPSVAPVTLPAPSQPSWEPLRASLAAATRAVLNDGVEVELLAEVGLRDGALAHVPWLRELPDPLTRTAWIPTARMAPALARSLGVSDGDVVSVTVGDAKVLLPARVLPGQHPRVVGVPVGYGRKDGDGADPTRNGARLLGIDAPRRAAPATIERTGDRVALPLMQTTLSAHGRPIIHQVSRPDEAVHGAHHPEADLWDDRDQGSPHWEMVIDLDACTGCGACVVSCQAENNIPVVGEAEIRNNRDMYWLRIDRYFEGDADDPDVLFEPMLCAQCDHAPCETVCPVAATVHSTEGLNQQVYNRCVGTRYCANNCPYKVRRFNWFEHAYDEPVERLVLNPDVVVRSRGVMEKCTFCVQRIQLARIDGKRDGKQGPPSVETACQQSCPARAIAFGDGTDPKGAVRALAKSPRAFRVLAEIGVKPSITYLARVRSREGAHHNGDES